MDGSEGLVGIAELEDVGDFCALVSMDLVVVDIAQLSAEVAAYEAAYVGD